MPATGLTRLTRSAVPERWLVPSCRSRTARLAYRGVWALKREADGAVGGPFRPHDLFGAIGTTTEDLERATLQ